MQDLSRTSPLPLTFPLADKESCFSVSRTTTVTEGRHVYDLPARTSYITQTTGTACRTLPGRSDMVRTGTFFSPLVFPFASFCSLTCGDKPMKQLRSRLAYPEVRSVTLWLRSVASSSSCLTGGVEEDDSDGDMTGEGEEMDTGGDEPVFTSLSGLLSGFSPP